MVTITEVAGTGRGVAGLAGCSGGRSAVAGAAAVQESQREQTEIRFVAQVDKTQVVVRVLCQSPFI